jgi:hypothetical protein
MARPTRLTDDLANLLARHVAEGGSIRGAGRALGEKLDPSLVCRWKNLSPGFRALMAGASLLDALRIFDRAGMSRVRQASNVSSLADIAHEAIYDESPEIRREAIGVLRAAVFSRWANHLPAGHNQRVDRTIGEAFDDQSLAAEQRS